MMSDFSENFQNKMSGSGIIDNFECKECKKTFKYDSHYKRHIQTHSDSRPYECEVCGKKFKRQDALKTHERTHSDDLPFKCSHEGCVESFASKAALRYHELRHINQTLHVCDKDGCNKKFLTLGQLKQHQRTKIHSKSSSGAAAQLYGDMESYNNGQSHHNSAPSLNNSGNLSNNSGYSQNQIYCNNAAPGIQFSQPQHFYNLQNQTSPKFLYSNNTNLIQNMSDYLSNENITVSSGFSTNSHFPSSNNISSSNHASQKVIQVKKEHRQEDTFLDDFSEDEQAFIDQIWSTIKQEGTNNDCESEKKHQEDFNESCNNNYHSEYPIQKRRRNNPIPSENKIDMNPNTSNLLMEFTRLNSSGYSFSRLKQELRIIVGLIDKIKKEDEDIVPPAPSNDDDDDQDYTNFTTLSQKNITPNNESKINNNSNQIKNNSTKSSEEQDYCFYQNDDSPFHNYECQLIQNNLPSEVIGKYQKEDIQMNGYGKSSDRPLLKKKIKTAVRLVQYCKKAFIEQKKQQIHQEQQQISKKRTSIQAQSQQPVQFNFNPKYEYSQPQQQFEFSAQFNQQQSNNNYQQIQYIPVEDYYPQQYQQQPKNNFLNQNLIKTQSGYSPSSSHLPQQPILQQGQSQYSQNNTFPPSINISQNSNFYNPCTGNNYLLEAQRIPQQQMIVNDGNSLCINSLNNTVIEDSQRHFSDIDSNQSSDNAGNIFDAADELQNNQLYNEEFINMPQFLPPQQFNNFRYIHEQC